MLLTVPGLRTASKAAQATMQREEQALNAADRVLGDGDTGLTLCRMFDKVAEAADEAPEDIGAFFRAIGMASANATGSSLGTLFALAFLEIAKVTTGQTTLYASDIPGLLIRARDTMMARGKTALGDKTVIDALDAVATGIASKDPAESMCGRAIASAHEVLDEFRDRPCRAGRARKYAEKSIGCDDPGMLAFVKLVEAVAGNEWN